MNKAVKLMRVLNFIQGGVYRGGVFYQALNVVFGRGEEASVFSPFLCQIQGKGNLFLRGEK